MGDRQDAADAPLPLDWQAQVLRAYTVLLARTTFQVDDSNHVTEFRGGFEHLDPGERSDLAKGRRRRGKGKGGGQFEEEADVRARINLNQNSPLPAEPAPRLAAYEAWQKEYTDWYAKHYKIDLPERQSNMPQSPEQVDNWNKMHDEWMNEYRKWYDANIHHWEPKDPEIAPEPVNDPAAEPVPKRPPTKVPHDAPKPAPTPGKKPKPQPRPGGTPQPRPQPKPKPQPQPKPKPNRRPDGWEPPEIDIPENLPQVEQPKPKPRPKPAAPGKKPPERVSPDDQFGPPREKELIQDKTPTDGSKEAPKPKATPKPKPEALKPTPESEALKLAEKEKRAADRAKRKAAAAEADSSTIAVVNRGLARAKDNLEIAEAEGRGEKEIKDLKQSVAARQLDVNRIEDGYKRKYGEDFVAEAREEGIKIFEAFEKKSKATPKPSPGSDEPKTPEEWIKSYDAEIKAEKAKLAAGDKSAGLRIDVLELKKGKVAAHQRKLKQEKKSQTPAPKPAEPKPKPKSKPKPPSPEAAQARSNAATAYDEIFRLSKMVNSPVQEDFKGKSPRAQQAILKDLEDSKVAFGEAAGKADLGVDPKDPKYMSKAMGEIWKSKADEILPAGETTLPSGNKVSFQDIDIASDGKQSKIIDHSGRKTVVANINGVNVPFYLSTGKGGKENVASGKWYPYFGHADTPQSNMSDGYFNKGSQDQINDYYGMPELKEASEWLDANVGDIQQETSLPKSNRLQERAWLESINRLADLKDTMHPRDPAATEKLDKNIELIRERLERSKK